jgi:hypothetical protein
MVSSKGNDGTAQKGIAIPAAYKNEEEHAI